MTELIEGTVKSIPTRTVMYGRCGPNPPYFRDEGAGSRCAECKARMKETGENHYCARLIPLASFPGSGG